MTQSTAGSNSPDDEKILEYAAELFQQLGIKRSPPDTVSWEDQQDPDMIIVRYGEIKLGRSMKGRLSPEDWKILLAPSIIYGYLLLRNQNRYSITHLVLPLGLAEFPLIVALLQIFHLPASANPRALLIITNILYIAYAASILLLYVKGRWRELVYKADRQATDALGRDNLLAALNRHRKTISQAGFLARKFHLWPTLTARIEHLEKTGPNQ